MVKVPALTFRVRVEGDEYSPPRYWDIWEYLPNQSKRPKPCRRKVYLGRSDRMDPGSLKRTKEHMFIPSTGDWPKRFTNWVEGIVWLQKLYREKNPGSGLTPLDTGT
jgi:hypothetical protein